MSGDKRDLLKELSVTREESAGTDGAPRRTRKVLVALLVVCLVFGSWFLAGMPGIDGADPLQLTTVTVQAGTGSRSAGAGRGLEAAGYVVARRQAAVSAQTTGKIAEILVEEGMQVEEGQLLARLDDRIPRAEYELAVARLDEARLAVKEQGVLLAQARRDENRLSALAHKGVVSQVTFEKTASSASALAAVMDRYRQAVTVASRTVDVRRQALADMEIRAPFTGIVTTKSAQPGEMISPIATGGSFARTGICTIVDMDSLEVEVDINESFLDQVREKQPAEVVLNSYAGKTFAARVAAIIPAADRNKATIRIRIEFLETDERILPGMGVRVSFLERMPSPAAQGEESGPVVPDSAVVQDGSASFVWRVEAGELERRVVEISDMPGSFTGIVSGLEAGDRIVARITPEQDAELSSGAPFVLDGREGGAR